MSSALEVIRKKISELSAKRGQFFKLKTGQNLLRFVPWDPNEPFYFESRQHFIPWGGARGTGIGVGCLEVVKKPCIACSLAEELADSDDPKSQNLGKQLQAHCRYLYCIVDLKNPEAGVQVFQSYSDRILADLCAAYADPDCGDFTDPTTGRNVVIEKIDKGKAPPEYKTTVKMKQTKLEGWKQLQSQVKNLKRLAPAADAKVMKELVAQFKSGDGASKSDAEAVTEGLPCFGHSYKKLPNCPNCGVRVRCKAISRSRSAKLKVRSKMKKKIGAE